MIARRVGTQIFKSALRFPSMATMKNPYQILGLKTTATSQQIKKSYRLIAQKYHPDKNPDPHAQKMFIQAKQAYQTLIDEDKRRQYDNEHTGGGTEDKRGYGFDKNPFQQFNEEAYRDKSRTYHDTFTSGSSRRRKGQNITRQIKLEFVDAVKGTTLEIQYERKTTCHECNGNRCKPGTAPTRCLTCGGSGSTVFRRGGIVMHLQCQKCKGVGLVIKNPCLSCKGAGIHSQKTKQLIEIPCGTENGQSITFKQKGNQSQNGPNGDLIIKINVNPHSRLRKMGQNILSNEWVTISQAALGTKKLIDTIWGKSQLKIPEGTQDGTRIQIPNEGVHSIKGKGDHIAVIRIKIPTELNQKQKKIFQQLARQQGPLNQEELNKKDARSKKSEVEDDGVFQKLKNIFK